MTTSPAHERTVATPLRIAVLTTGRQDYGILRSTVVAMRSDARFELLVWAGGMHLDERYGSTISLVRGDVDVARELPFLGPDDVVADAAEAMRVLAAALRADRPDAILLVGDRSETTAAGLAAVLLGVPIIHLHGGEESEGAIDNQLRHALTKMAHLHLVSHPSHAARVLQMGESARDVVVVGAAGLDNLHRSDLDGRTELERRLRHDLPAPLVVVTVHPETLGVGADANALAVGAAMDAQTLEGVTWVITQPNADHGGAAIRRFWTEWAASRPRAVLTDALGERGYWGLLRLADAVLGNSSSGLIEAPALGLPVVNVGDRQRGRLRSAHVTDVPADATQIEAAVRVALAPSRRSALAREPGYYPPGPVAPRILDAIARWSIPRPPRKRFREAT